MSALRLLPLLLLLPACEAVRERLTGGGGGAVTAPATSPSPAARPIPAGARTAEAFDTTTEEERAAATAPAEEEGGEEPLGTTVVSLGDPADPGLWLATPLVSETRPGRVALGGQSVRVELRPIEGPSTAGSRISLPALRLLGASLAGLPEVEVFGL